MSVSPEQRVQKLARQVESPVSEPGLLHPWYGLATLLYVGGITWLSSIPRAPAPPDLVLEYGLNIGHIPLFAGLTVLLVKTITPNLRPFLTRRACTFAALLLFSVAMLDEIHQSFVPGRSASVLDLGLDVMGIGAVLLFYRLSALVLEGS